MALIHFDIIRFRLAYGGFERICDKHRNNEYDECEDGDLVMDEKEGDSRDEDDRHMFKQSSAHGEKVGFDHLNIRGVAGDQGRFFHLVEGADVPVAHGFKNTVFDIPCNGGTHSNSGNNRHLLKKNLSDEKDDKKRDGGQNFFRLSGDCDVEDFTLNELNFHTEEIVYDRGTDQ